MEMLMEMICTIDLLGSVCFNTSFNDKNFKEPGYTYNEFRVWIYREIKFSPLIPIIKGKKPYIK